MAVERMPSRSGANFVRAASLTRSANPYAGSSFFAFKGSTMNARILAIALTLGLAACANQQMPSTSMSMSGAGAAAGSPTRLQSRMCQVFRSYEDRAAGGELQEACNRQLGPQMCARCLDSGF
jgi:hypothetical protein